MTQQGKKPGPKTRKGERRPFLLYLPLDIWEALERVAQPEPGYTAFIEAAIREKLEKESYRD